MNFRNNELFQLIKSFVFIILTALILSHILTLILPKEYSSHTTFIFPEMNSTSSSQSVLSVKLLGGYGASGVEKYVVPILESKRIKYLVASKFRNDFERELTEAFQDRVRTEMTDLKFIIGHLKLHKNITIFKEKQGLMKIVYSNENPAIITKVVKNYLNGLNEISEDLDLTQSKRLFVILDPIETPQYPHSPNQPKFFVMITILFGSIYFYRKYKYLFFDKK